MLYAIMCVFHYTPTFIWCLNPRLYFGGNVKVTTYMFFMGGIFIMRRLVQFTPLLLYF